METVRALRELVLAPQSELPLVRRFLYRNGFAICEEKMVFEDGKYYPVMKVKPPGIDNAFLKDTEEGIGQRLGILFGPCLLQERDPVLEQYLLKQKKICERNIRQITEHGNNKTEPRLAGLLQELADLNSALEYYTPVRNRQGAIPDGKEDKVIHLKVNGCEQEWPEGTSYYEIARKYEESPENSSGERILLVREGFLLRELHHEARDKAEISFLTGEDSEGRNAYRRSVCLLMLKSIENLTGGADRYHVKVHFAAGGGWFCTLEDSSLVTEDFLQEVIAGMRELVRRRIPLKKAMVDTREAVRLFEQRGMKDKVQLFAYRMSSKTNVYDLDGYTDYFYGYMVHDTSYLTHFDLKKYEEGFVLRFTDDDQEEFAPARKLFKVQHDSMLWSEKISLSDVGDLNDCIVKGQARDLILTQEAWHEKQIAQIAQKIADDPRIRIVLIAGPSSSGKTTFSHRLSTQLTVHGLRPHPIPMDDYFLEREKTPRHPDGSYNFECLEAIDVEQFNRDMCALLAGEDVELPVFNFVSGKREYKGKHLRIGPKDILVIEGIHGLNEASTYMLPRESKFKIYISALCQLNIDEHNRIPTTDERLIRRIVRDARTRGTNAQETIEMWKSVRQGEMEYIFPYQESCDEMFNSALVYELAVLKVYAQPLLFSVDEASPAFIEAKRLLKFLDYFLPLSTENIPIHSLVREFTGGSCY